MFLYYCLGRKADKYSGKELDEESGLDWYYFGARYYDPVIGRWLSVDPLASLTPGLNPYHYVRNNPINRIDPTGNKDKAFNAKTDKYVKDQPGTMTLAFIRNSQGVRIAYTVNHMDAYNCHSYAWHSSEGDLNNTSSIKNDPNLPKWDNDPSDDLNDFTQLGNDENNIKGDRVIYFIDANSNGKYDSSEEIIHSAVVESVDKDGYTTTVIGKRGELGISINHPNAPGYYKTSDGKSTSRAYFRDSQTQKFLDKMKWEEEEMSRGEHRDY